MRVVLASLLLSVVFVSLIGNSYAQSDQTRPTLIFVQTVVRNSDGQLVAYLEANKIFVPSLDLLNAYLDTQSPQRTFVNAGKSYDLIHLEFPQNISGYDVVSKTAFGIVVDNKQVMIAYSDHDGYPLVAGDTVTSIWTIVRPSH
jgi:hypothetical protein